MKIALYLDEDSQDTTLIRALRSRGVDVIAASEAGMNGRSDDEQLQWSTTAECRTSKRTRFLLVREVTCERGQSQSRRGQA